MLVLVQRRGRCCCALYSRALLPWAQYAAKKCCISWRRRSAVYAAPSGQTCGRRTRGSILEFHSASAIFASEEAVVGLIRWVLEQIGGKFCFPAVAQRRAPMDSATAGVDGRGESICDTHHPTRAGVQTEARRRGPRGGENPRLILPQPAPEAVEANAHLRRRPRCVGYRTTRADSDRAGCRR